MAAPQQEDRPFVLVTNGAGIKAPELRHLVQVLHPVVDIAVVVPDADRRGAGHAITLRQPVRATPEALPGEVEPIPAWSVTGTPVDCVKLAISQLLEREPDVVVSGINRGPSTAVNALYSGTVSSAAEAAILGIPAFAVSLASWDSDQFDTTARVARWVLQKVLSQPLPPGIFLNVNVPPRRWSELKGVHVTKQAHARWEQSHRERQDPQGKLYYWLDGRFVPLEDNEGTDLHAVDEGYVSITPLHYDLTARRTVDALGFLDGIEIES